MKHGQMHPRQETEKIGNGLCLGQFCASAMGQSFSSLSSKTYHAFGLDTAGCWLQLVPLKVLLVHMYICRYVYKCAHGMVQTWRAEDNLLVSVLSSTIWILGTKLRSSGLVAINNLSHVAGPRSSSLLQCLVLYC